ncbi:uncharacterized protein LOC132557537 [Ylistrum balloti]|uniref:uncharacterized protein LOC132557537 n=1 Tax=Ylistrum balloti TaxID=509963 RepID=UPI002905B7B3|nr:uncharacterized protein LOC132557537 [Ylistrum balloti]
MDCEIDFPADFILQHKLDPENLHILDVTQVPVDTWELLNYAAKPSVSDNHYESQVLRFRYAYAERRNGLLKIQHDGQVCVNGEVCDKDTFFKVIHDFSDNYYQIIGITDQNQNKVLYMDGINLKTREYKHGYDDNSLDTRFVFELIGNNSWKIMAKETGHVIEFDLETGMYLPKKADDQKASPPIFCNPDVGPRLQAYVPVQMKITTV